jgi:hypothetical protein
MIARVERAFRRAFHKRAQERPLHLERFATETSSTQFPIVFLRKKKETPCQLKRAVSI